MMKFNSLLKPSQIQPTTKTIPNSTPYCNHPLINSLLPLESINCYFLKYLFTTETDNIAVLKRTIIYFDFYDVNVGFSSNLNLATQKGE